jgi:murein L,D-transpeptidase YafK
MNCISKWTHRKILIFFFQCLVFLTFISASPAPRASDRQPANIKLVPDRLISLSSEDGGAYAILVEKESQRVIVYEYRGTFSAKDEFPCSTGEADGTKQKPGDQKTPEGIYFFTEVFKKKELGPIYGRKAYVIDYPNFLDRKFGREGNSIWLHGSDKPIKPRDSNGCIVMNNGDLDRLSHYIQLNRTPIIVAQKFDMVPTRGRAEDEESLTSFLNGWKNAFVGGDWARFSACYAEPHGNLDALRRGWDRIRNFQKRGAFPVRISFKNLTLLRGNPGVVALFDQVIHLDRQMRAVNTKKLFLKRNNKTWRIIGEIYQPEDANRGAGPPLFHAVNRLDQIFTDHRAIVDLVAEWADAWSSKDITRYRACYTQDFLAGGIDLKTWISRKETLNRRYDRIHVAVEGLSVEQGLEQSKVTFLQKYDASGYQAEGTKRLQLKRVRGTWRIYREKWNALQKQKAQIVDTKPRSAGRSFWSVISGR